MRLFLLFFVKLCGYNQETQLCFLWISYGQRKPPFYPPYSPDEYTKK